MAARENAISGRSLAVPSIYWTSPSNQPEHSPCPFLARTVRAAQRVPSSDGLGKDLGLQIGLQLGNRPLPVASAITIVTSANVRLGMFSVAQFRPFYALVMRPHMTRAN